MKINKPYTVSNVEKNRIRGLHESVKNKNLINEQQYMHYSCETSTCQCVPTGPGLPPPNTGYFSLQDCLADTSTCCSQTGGQSGCMDPSLGGYDPQATTDCAGNPVPNPVGPFGDTGCCGMPGPQEWVCMGGVVGPGGTNTCTGPHPVGTYQMGQPNVMGIYPDQATCSNMCSQAGGQTYACNQGQCVADPNGQFATLQDCVGQCGQNQWWCQHGFAGPVGCFQSPTNPGGTTTGPYQSQAHCSNLCSQSQNTWKCKNIGSHPKFGKKCTQVQPGQGNFPTKSDCEDAGCGPRRADVEYEKEFATSSTSPRRADRSKDRTLAEEREQGMVEPTLIRGGGGPPGGPIVPPNPAGGGTQSTIPGGLPKGWVMKTPEELDEENAMDDLYEVWLGHEDNVVLEAPYTIKEKIYELPARFGNKRLTETEMVNMINSIIK